MTPMFQKFAKISDQFLRAMMASPHRKVGEYRSSTNPKKVVSIFTIDEADASGVVVNKDSYFYTQRNGKDSVSIMVRNPHVFDDGEPAWLILQYWHGPLSRIQRGAITCSMDDGLSPIDLALKELKEEAGLILDLVDEQDIRVLATVPLTGNSNESVHLVVVDLEAISFNFQSKAGDSDFEENTNLHWMRQSKVFEDIRCWRALTTVALYQGSGNQPDLMW